MEATRLFGGDSRYSSGRYLPAAGRTRLPTCRRKPRETPHFGLRKHHFGRGSGRQRHSGCHPRAADCPGPRRVRLLPCRPIDTWPSWPAPWTTSARSPGSREDSACPRRSGVPRLDARAAIRASRLNRAVGRRGGPDGHLCPGTCTAGRGRRGLVPRGHRTLPRDDDGHLIPRNRMLELWPAAAHRPVLASAPGPRTCHPPDRRLPGAWPGDPRAGGRLHARRCRRGPGDVRAAPAATGPDAAPGQSCDLPGARAASWTLGPGPAVASISAPLPVMYLGLWGRSNLERYALIEGDAAAALRVLRGPLTP